MGDTNHNTEGPGNGTTPGRFVRGAVAGGGFS